jgi:RNA polymerase sigma-70 factor (ECF subfamily)
VIAALAARFRDLDLAEEAFAEACARAAAVWTPTSTPDDAAAWLYRTAQRAALDAVRRRQVRERYAPDVPPAELTIEERMTSEDATIPDERLRLIFVCCHPAVAPDARAALTLKLVCGLTTEEIARAFLLAETTLAQRLVRAKRKIATAGVRFEVPGPQAWNERLDAVLSTIEIAYAKAHEDAAGAGRHAGYAAEMLNLTTVLASLLPREPDVLALAAIVRFAEARRPARVGGGGEMVPLSEQDPGRWNSQLIGSARKYLERGLAIRCQTARLIQAAIHGCWCARSRLDDPLPWPDILRLYDALLRQRGDTIVRLNRLVALAEVMGVPAALGELEALEAGPALLRFLPYQALRADLLRRAGRSEEAADAYRAALALGPGPAEMIWLRRQLGEAEQCATGLF